MQRLDFQQTFKLDPIPLAIARRANGRWPEVVKEMVNLFPFPWIQQMLVAPRRQHPPRNRKHHDGSTKEG